jgi:hypothetical protein
MVVLLQGVFGRYVRSSKTRKKTCKKTCKKTHWYLKPLAGVAIANRGREKREAERQHEDVHHEILLSVGWRGR